MLRLLDMGLLQRTDKSVTPKGEKMIQTKSETVNLLVVEEQEIYREIYINTLPKNADINILRISDVGEKGSILRSAAELTPDVIILSIK